MKGALVEGVVILLVFALAGVGAGFLWHAVWSPPVGGVVDGRWLYADWTAIGKEADATALFVVIGLPAGAVLGLLAALLAKRSEIVTLVAVVVGAVAATYLCHRIGMHLAPPDPDTLAAGLPDDTTLPDTMRTPGRSWMVAWPLGALGALGLTYFLTAGLEESSRRETTDPTWMPRPPAPGPAPGPVGPGHGSDAVPR